MSLRALPSFVVAAVLVTGLAACAPAEPPDTRAQDEAAIREADTAFAAAAATKDVEAIMAFFTDDAVALPPNAPMASGKAALRAEWETMIATPGMSVSWSPTTVVASGDLGYSIGTATMSMTGPDGAAMSDSMKYVTIWRRQADGSWKVAVDAYSSNTPMAGAGS